VCGATAFSLTSLSFVRVACGEVVAIDDELEDVAAEWL
jgi:hypothetical protein